MKRTLLLLPFLVLAAPARADKDDAPARADLRLMARNNNTFAARLYGQLRAEKGNLFFSPFSITTALAMTSAGAKGDTLTEMEKALDLAPQKLLHPALGHLLREYTAKGRARDYDLDVASTLFGQVGYRWNKDFTDLLERHYDAGMQQVDYQKHAERAREAINAWAQKNTRDKIKNLIPPGALTNRTRLILANAIYFRGDWKLQFKKESTKSDDFHVSADRKVKADLMFQAGSFALVEDAELQALELGYKGDDVSMVVLLPKKRNALDAVEKGLTGERLAKLFGQLGMARQRKVLVWLPRFTFTKSIGLKDALQKLGMKKAFGAGDLSGMDGTSTLFVQDVVHKAYIEVDEKGTKAAAATAVIVGTKSKPPAPPEFRADHPFIFLIRDKKTDNLLFLGRLSDPTSK